MSSFSSPLIVSPMPDGKYWKIIRRFTYRIGKRYSRRMISVRAGFPTDFASVPRIIWWLLPWWAKYNKASVLHDWLYLTKQIMKKPITRKEADQVWLEAMLIDFRNHKHGKFVAYLEYFAVRAFGFQSWKKSR